MARMPANSVIPRLLLAATVFAAAVPALARDVHYSPDRRGVAAVAAEPGRAIPAERIATARPVLPMLASRSQLPGYPKVSTQAYGLESHPFTTKAAYSSAAQPAPVTLSPWRSTGKLVVEKGGQTYVCTASVIGKGLLVTAAHCVWDFGVGPVDTVSFQPALHDATARYGTWTAASWYVSSTYDDGSDTCSTAGVVCNNDIAIVVLDTGPAPHTGKYISQVVGKYGYFINNQGYVNFLGKKAAQITQFGYPAAIDSGLRMIRTDSLGYQAAPNNLIIGSDQTGGSSGGPWIMNFGTAPSSTNPVAAYSQSNRVVATTSWGYTDATLKVQGGSRFANNAEFPAPGPSNIQFLIDFACSGPEHPDAC